MSEVSVDLKHFSGPNKYLPFRAMVMQFDCEASFRGDLSPIPLEQAKKLSGILDQNIFDAVTTKESLSHPAHFLKSLSVAILSTEFDCDLRSFIDIKISNDTSIAIECFDLAVAKRVIIFAIRLTLFIKGFEKIDSELVKKRINQLVKMQKGDQPGQTGLCLMRAAEKLNIPYYYLNHTHPVVCYGQGKHSLFFHEASSQFDSNIGTRMQGKVDTHLLLDQMGYPSPSQYIVNDMKSALDCAAKIGFPLAIKPIHESKGKGVSCNIRSIDELKAGYDLASPYENGRAIIEEHIEGFDHRITLAGGEIIEAICKIPPFLIGDNNSSISELIQKKNIWYEDQNAKGVSSSKGIVVDEHVVKLLQKANMDLGSVPKFNDKIYLRNNSNLSTGATFTDVIGTLHPDNIKMFKDIVRVFRMDIVGIDYISPDITRSWKEMGKVLEFNATPGLVEEQALALLKDKFDEKECGRIPTLLLLNLSENDEKDIVNSNEFEHGSCGVINSDITRLGDNERLLDGKDLYDKCLSLLIDPACESLIICAAIEDLLTDGLPIDHFDRCIFDRSLIEEKDDEKANFFSWLDSFCDVMSPR